MNEIKQGYFTEVTVRHVKPTQEALSDFVAWLEVQEDWEPHFNEKTREYESHEFRCYEAADIKEILAHPESRNAQMAWSAFKSGMGINEYSEAVSENLGWSRAKGKGYTADVDRPPRACPMCGAEDQALMLFRVVDKQNTLLMEGQ